jgi:GT2 family glycosyltransferase
VSVAPSSVFAVICNWNGGGDNIECIESLLNSGFSTHRIVFVDNGSEDGSREAVAARFPGISRIDNPDNRGFGEASNQGARWALERGAQAVFFVNNDLVVEPGVLEGLCARLDRHPSRGIVGPRVLYKDDPSRVWCAGGMLTWRQNLSTLLGHQSPDGPLWRVERAVDYIPGCALLARAELLEQVGLFDASYFAYMEDVDLCLRARRSGWEVWLAGELAVRHGTSRATGGGYNPRRKWMMGVNSIWFLRRHAGTREWMRFVVFDVLSLPFLLVGGVFHGRAKAVVAKAVGIWDGMRGKRVCARDIQSGAGWLW